MKSTKKVIALILVVTLAVTSMSIFYADDMTDGAEENTPFSPENTEYKSLEEQLSEIINNPMISAEQKQRASEKYYRITAILNGQKMPHTRGVGTVLPVPHCNQETKWYCGPASVQQILKYYFKSQYPVPNQDTIARYVGIPEGSESGADSNLMVTYLNGKLWSNDFGTSYFQVWKNWGSDPSKLKEYIMTYIDAGVPIIINYNTNEYRGNWPYSTGGHYVCISGYANYCEDVYIVDPYITQVGSSYPGGSYFVDITTLNNTITRIIF